MHAFGSHTVPNTSHVLQMTPSRDPRHGGFDCELGSTVSTDLRNALTGSFGVKLFADFMRRFGMVRPAFAMHPGGRRILDRIRDALSTLRFEDPLKDSYGVSAGSCVCAHTDT